MLLARRDVDPRVIGLATIDAIMFDTDYTIAAVSETGTVWMQLAAGMPMVTW